jgi:hypothetical protein
MVSAILAWEALVIIFTLPGAKLSFEMIMAFCSAPLNQSVAGYPSGSLALFLGCRWLRMARLMGYSLTPVSSPNPHMGSV